MKRCAWAEGDPLMSTYHDTEWGVPVKDSRAMWEMLMLEGFQAGLSWRTILHRREGFRTAFHNFNPDIIAKYSEKDVERLMADPGIIRARAKILATINGARIYRAHQTAGEDFSAFAWSFTNYKPLQGDGQTVPASTALSTTISTALKKRGYKFCGPVITYAWMQAIGLVNDHAQDCFCRKRTPAQPNRAN
jgi:DNA-3-methyladenine glycosylase I